jgi:tyrosine-protein phosphatase SIW14
VRRWPQPPGAGAHLKNDMRLFAIALAAAVLAFPGWGADVAGVRNFRQVNEHIYRGAQPTAQGLQSLSNLGVKTVIDLREAGGRSRAEQKIVESAGMRYVSVPLSGIAAPSDAQVAKLLAMLDDGSAGPVFIHCRRGLDRTGTVCACYRIAHDGWENKRALEEARSLGMSWLEKAMQHYVLHFGVTANASSAPPVGNALPASR